MIIRGLLLLASLLLVAGAARGQSVYEVDRDQVNVRQDATTQSTRVGVLHRGEQVVELRRVGLWMHVRMPDGLPGWIHAQLLRQRMLVEGDGLRLRADPSATGTSVTMLFRGQQVTRLSQSGSWTQVELQDGRKGWLASQFVRAKSELDLQAERPAPSRVATAEDDSAAPPAAESMAGTPAATPVVRRDPYAEGLQLEAGGDYALALDRFLEVVAEDPGHVNALVHAAQGHERLGEHEAALEKLYRGLQLTGGRKDIYLTLSRIYRLQVAPDSSAKYQALFRGEAIPIVAGLVDTSTRVEVPSPLPRGTVLDDLPKKRGTVDDVDGLFFDTAWLPVGLAGIGLLALAAVGWWVVSTSTHRTQKGAAVAGDRGFEKVWDEESQQARRGRATTEEETELDGQINSRWQELRESAAAFAPKPATAEGVDGILDQVDGLRQTLEGQDERARIYADIVRLQNMKIEAMTEEISRLRKG
ncbi:MAG: SH3 domain-containing protein [bacterium]|nr:SH3 domain-containing protein [bacterium]